MKSKKISKPSIRSALRPTSRRAVSVSEERLVGTRQLEGQTIPLVVEPGQGDEFHLVDWARGNRPFIEELLMEHRALLFRGFEMSEASDFDAFIHATSDGRLLEYRDRSSPRHEVEEKIYTSTDYPAEQKIFLHNEGTYWLTWPLKIYFFCHTPAEEKGATPIADCRRILARIDPEVRRCFEERKVMYVRNFNSGFGLPWQTAFQTDDLAEVEEYCRQSGIEVERRAGDQLRTRQVRQAVAEHPRTGEAIWFNHATFFHVSTLEPSIRASLEAEFAPEDLPYNTYYGDGSPIEPEVLDALREAYRAETVRFPWQQGDVLMLDNMSIAHGREAYVGDRRVLVGMVEPYSPPENQGLDGGAP